MIDIHSHILPGVDDGAGDQETSLSILSILADNGIKTVCLTPHVNKKENDPSPLLLQAKYNELNRLAAVSKLDITLLQGAEILFSPGIKGIIKNNPLCFLGESSMYYLLEFINNQIPSIAEKVIFDAMLEGVVPVFAHVERYDWRYRRIADLMGYFKKNSAMLQVNSGSLLGKYGRTIKKRAVKLVKEGWCDVIAGDIHTKEDAVKYNLRKASQFVTKQFGRQKSRQLLFEMPAKIIQK
ncbi:MAG: CpsB/CapC family capsule biosynthesis tyrosine phosphatase [Desulfobacteraceae bacterium]